MAISKQLFKLAKTSLGDLIIGISVGTPLSKLLPVKRVRETNQVLAFWHPKPSWEKHILIVPKKPIKNLTSCDEKDFNYVEEVYKIAKEVVEELGWDKKGYSIITNGGDRQEVNQLHFHLTSGNRL